MSKIYGYLNYLYTGAWPPSPDYVQYPDSVRINYESEGLPAGESDKFYVSDVSFPDTLTPAQVVAAGGTPAATVTDGTATTVMLTGLAQDRQYYVRAVRHDSSNVPIAVSNLDVVRTSLASLAVTPANADMLADWATEQFTEWFLVDNGAQHLTFERLGGGFVRMSNTVGSLYYDSNDLEWYQSGDNYIPGFCVFDGKKRLSPRHDFTIEIPVRISPLAGTTLDRENSYEEQFQFGINSGVENVVAIETRRAHASSNHLDKEGLGAFTNTNGDWGLQEEARLYGTMYGISGNTVDAKPQANTSWRLGPSAAHADYAKWKVPHNVATVIKYVYSATSKSLQVYIGANLITTLGGVHSPLGERKKFPLSDYPLAVTPSFRLQSLVYRDSDQTTVDIGAVRLQSSCPYGYMGWSAESGHHGSFSPHADGPVTHYDPSAHTLSNLRLWHPDAAKRYTTGLWTGYTVPTVDGRPAGTPIYATENATPHPETGLAAVYVTDLITAKTLPTPVPPGQRVAKVAFQGLKLYGAVLPSGNVGIEGRLLDQDDQPLTDWVQIDGVYGTALTDVAPNAATSVRAEVRLQYDGSAINYASINVIADNFEAPTPNCPSLFNGYEAYYEIAPILSIADAYSASTAGSLTLTLAGGTLAIGDAFSASISDNLTLSLVDDGGTLAISSAYSASSSDNLTLALALSPIGATWAIKPANSGTRTLKTQNGSPLTLRRNIAGTWQ
jgi:hypothetical protein